MSYPLLPYRNFKGWWTFKILCCWILISMSLVKKKNLCWLWCCFSKHLKVDVKFLFFFFGSSINCHIGKYVFYGTVTLELLMMNFRVYSECGNKIGILIFCIMYSSLVCTYLRLLISFDITFFLCVCLLLDRWHVDLWDTKTSEICLCPCGLCSLMGKYSSL